MDREALEELKTIAQRAPEFRTFMQLLHSFETDPHREEALDAAADVFKQLPKLIAEVERSQWQTIDTAPKDASEILLRAPEGCVVAHWAYGGGEDQPPFGPAWFYNAGTYFNQVASRYKPTHWMPLPALQSGGSNAK